MIKMTLCKFVMANILSLTNLFVNSEMPLDLTDSRERTITGREYPRKDGYQLSIDVVPRKRSRPPRLWLALGLLVLALAAPLSGILPPSQIVAAVLRFPTFVTIFLGIFLEAIPFLLAGSVASGFISVYLDEETLARFVPRQAILATFIGATMGLLFPVCECGVVPLTRSLYRKGLPLSMGISFMLAAPAINPIVLIGTYTAFGWGAVFWGRIGLSFLIATAVGLTFTLARPADVFNPQMLETHCACHAVLPRGTERMPRFWLAMVAAGDEFIDMSHYLVIGALLTALIQTLIPQTVLLGIGQGPLTSVVALSALAFLLSVCSTVDAFVALAFVNTFTTGAILAFLVFGPMVDIKSALMYASMFKRHVVLYLILLTFLMTLLTTLYINLNLGW